MSLQPVSRSIHPADNFVGLGAAGSASRPHQVVIAEPQWLVRKGLLSVVDQIAACHVVGEAGTGAEALAAVAQLRPTLVLLSLSIADPGCTEVIKQLRERGGSPKVLVLSQHRAEAGARDALRAGCDGFIDKEHGGEALERAILEVLAGRPFLDAQVSRRLLLGHDDAPDRGHDALAVLTQRERAVFVRIAEGHTNRSAGEVLHISSKTVEKHRALVMQKLKLRSAVDLRLLAVDLGLIERPSHDGLARQLPGVSLAGSAA